MEFPEASYGEAPASSPGSSPHFERLLSPFSLGPVALRNRIVSTPHTTWFGESGKVGERYTRYYEEKARGGVGLLQAFGSMAVHPSSPARDWGVIENFDDSVLPGLEQFADRMHKHGAKVMAQLTHRGRRGSSGAMERPLVAPSPIPEGQHREIPRELERETIREIVRAFASAARRLQRAGFDGAEICAYSRHLVDQFWHVQTNRRADEYGGSLDNRMRFAVEVISATRDAVGPGFALGVRMSANELIPDGMGPEMAIEIAQRLESLRALDYFSFAGGTGERSEIAHRSMPFGDQQPAVFAADVAMVRGALSVPVIYAGGVREPDTAERLLADGACDLVGMTRALMADPNMPNLVRAGLTLDVRPCLGIQEGCLGRNSSGLLLSCTHNPVTGREAELAELPRAPKPRRVVVVGGGPGGLEAARTAALRGHQVLLLERDARLGGQVLIAGRSTFRPHWARIATWLDAQVRRHGVEIRTGVDASADLVLAQQPDAVIVATGSEPMRPEIAGATLDGVCDVEDVLTGRCHSGAVCLVADELGTIHAPLAALSLAAEGRRVVLVTPHHAVADLSQRSTQEPLYEALYRSGVELRTEHRVTGLARTDSSLRVTMHNVYDGLDRTMDADSVVLTGSRRARDDLYRTLRKRKPELELHLIGDANAPRSVHDAVLEATRAARVI